MAHARKVSMCDEHPKFLDDAYLDLNDFEVTDESLGMGQQGHVFKCYRKSDRKLFVIKLVKSAFDDPRSTKLFLREVEVQVRLSHKYFSIFRGFTIPDDSPAAIILDYMPNGNLQDKINAEFKGQVTPGWDGLAKSKCVFGIAAGLAYAHLHGVIHRDLKPENILLDANMEPCIGDFGLAIIPERLHLSQRGNALHMAPEVVNGESPTVASDMYGYAIILYALFVPLADWSIGGRSIRSFGPKPAWSIMQLVGRGQRWDKDPRIPEFYWNLIINCWEQNQNERWTAIEVLERLKASIHEYAFDKSPEAIAKLREYQDRVSRDLFAKYVEAQAYLEEEDDDDFIHRSFRK